MKGTSSVCLKKIGSYVYIYHLTNKIEKNKK